VIRKLGFVTLAFDLGEGMKVLIVDDEVLQLEVIEKLITGWGHLSVLAGSGKQAIEQLRMSRFDLFMLDVFLPDMTAIELIPQIKALQSDARIITLTGQSSRELERRVRELGIAYYMAKPFQRDELHSILTHLAGRSRTAN
jgi:CheY-like chemotaxis protein